VKKIKFSIFLRSLIDSIIAFSHLAIDRLRKAKERDTEKHQKQIKRQDKIFFVGFYVLLNLAEDSSVERKMVTSIT